MPSNNTMHTHGAAVSVGFEWNDHSGGPLIVGVQCPLLRKFHDSERLELAQGE